MARNEHAIDIDYTETSKKRKGDFIRPYEKKYMELGFTIVRSSEKVSLPKFPCA